MRKISENLLKLSNIKLLEHLQLLEEYILEATWTNVRQFQRHYDDHVLDEDEDFNPDNPKFVHMEEQDYKDMAEKFSELPADKATYRVFYNNDGTVSNRLMNTRSNVIGFILKPDVGKYQRVTRKAKIIKTPIEYLPNGVSGEEYRTLVVYVDEGGEDEIISCYLLRPKKMFGIFKYQFEDELPENQEKVNIDSVLNSIIEKYSTNSISYGSMYILPDGTLLDLGDSGYGHSDLSAYLNDVGVENDYEQGKASKLLKSLGWIRLNTKLKFIDFPDKMFTSAQEQKLKDAIDYMGNDVQVTVGGQTKIYKDKIPEYILYRVKRSYSSGTLYESK